MRAIGLFGAGEQARLELIDLPEPQAGPGEVRIRVHAAAVNPSDLNLRTGYWGQRPEPLIIGMDLAGVIDQVGPGVHWTPGARVMAAVAAPNGAYTTQIVLPATAIARIPAGASMAEAATLPMNGLTADMALDMLDLRAGQTVAVTGAAGAAGGHTVALARLRGLTVLADSAPADERRVRDAGAHVIIPRGSGFAAAVRDSVPAGVDGLVDGALLQADALGAIRDGGAYVGLRPYIGQGERGITIGHTSVRDRLPGGARLESLRELVEQGVLKLDVAGTYHPQDAELAHRRMAQGGVRGRLVLDLALL
ncbi:NADP-dependent oxidoreductase [Pseudonocardiaceae bacterium YIM PH 21723]|nr:NADP-dependent oxidoreductase [Pseudonocardiaceae bacterium YIM PH 21723]